MLLTKNHYDIAILFSGDDDFTRYVSELQKQNEHILVVSTEKSKTNLVAHELKVQAGIFIEFAENTPHVNQRKYRSFF